MNLHPIIRTLGFYLLVLFYFGAGINHFLNPDFYIPLIPGYLPFPRGINIIAGILEIVLSLSLLIPSFKKGALIGLVVLLILFIPSHIYFIQIGSCVEDSLCVSPWIAWIRLLLIHPLLIGWVLLYLGQKK
ncbi:Uncharacterized membrane protein [Algoriphagus faecimaris]|uniref:Uncharacterized membrane protein n=1 Tax=Algoriphagus faecimaris TaxID=686796 RepID=A0A1G6PGU2_9BACT|nr:hypothetical protein [Algoriphagus faecimaris]SDC79383.1 Uncharacterized membrane protein [Algoriphagus faecimaris]